MNRSANSRFVIMTAMLVCLLAIVADVDAQQRGGPRSVADYNDPQCDVWVTGSNSDLMDPDAVSLAVNGGLATPSLTVCLVGTFNFGETGRVFISPPAGVEELRITGINGATIWFGFQPLSFMQTSTVAKLTIDHIRFVQPTFTAISVFQGNELVQISDNIVEGVRTTAPLAIPPFDPLTYREGIVVTSAFTDITGKVVVKDNWVDGGLYDPALDATINVVFGIGVFGPFVPGNSNSFSADVEVSGNTVRNWSGSGIGTRTLDADTVIEHNLIEPGFHANDVPGACVTNGIHLIGTSNAIVRRNTIDVSPASTISGTGPDCTAALAVVSDPLNSIAANDNSLGNNHILGQGLYGIVLRGIPGAASEDNTFTANRLSTFAADAADVWLNPDANNNTFVGNVGTVLDQGSGNTFRTTGGP